ASRTPVEQLQARGLALVSGLTRYELRSRAERMAVPGHPLLLFGFVPIWLSGLSRGRLRRAAFAAAPLMLVRRTAYEAAGGHAAVPGSLRDDIDLARSVAGSGRRGGRMHAARPSAARDLPRAHA